MPKIPALDARFSAKVVEAFRAFGLPGELRVRAATAEAPAEILLYDEIGMWGVTAKDFMGAMAKAGAGPLTVRINSPGGDVFDGLAIYNALKSHPGGVTTQVDGLAASAASYIAMAGQSVQMHESSMMMIHNAWGVAVGNKADMRQTADTLDKIDGQLAGIYAAKTGETTDDIAGLMDAETWFTASEAKAAGLCDAVIPAPKAAKATLARAPVAAADWSVGAARDLPIDEKDAWDGPAAAERMLSEAGFDGDTPDPTKAKRGFLVYDAANPKEKGSYKLPFADIVGGALKAVRGGIDAAASRLPSTDIPDALKPKAREVIDGYEKAAPSSNRRDNLARRLRLAVAEGKSGAA